jgi:CrcB protein
MRFIWIGVGGAVGSMLRFGIGLWFSTTRFPSATLTVNLVGSFSLGLLFTYALGRWPMQITTALAVGLLGGFTTFSTFAWETFTMAQAGDIVRGVVYLFASLAGGLGAALLGYTAGRALA